MICRYVIFWRLTFVRLLSAPGFFGLVFETGLSRRGSLYPLGRLLHGVFLSKSEENLHSGLCHEQLFHDWRHVWQSGFQ